MKVVRSENLHPESFSLSNTLKGQGHVTVNKPVISRIYIVAHMWPLCSTQISVDGVNPLESYFQKSTNISAIVQHMSFFVCLFSICFESACQDF